MIEHIKPKAVISETIDNWLISTKEKQQSNNLSIIDYRASLFSDCFANTKQRVDEITDYKRSVQKLPKFMETLHHAKRVMRQVQKS